MESKSKKALEDYRKVLVAALMKEYEKQDIKAYGDFGRFIQSEESATITDDRYVQKGTAYTYSQDVGYSHVAPFRVIYNWLILKKYNLNWDTDEERRSITWAILKNQKKDQYGAKGSFKRRNPSDRTDMIDKSVKETRTTLLSLLTTAYLAEALSPVSDKIKQINAEQNT